MPRKLGQLSLSLRYLLSLAMLVLAAGYGVAVVNLYYTYSRIDGQPGLTVEDLRRAFSGQRSVTRLAAKIDGGSMEQYLPDPLDKARILNWIQDGAAEDRFGPQVRPILEKNCWRCHNPGGLMYLRPLQSYAQVKELTKAERGEPPPVWARVAHTHLQSLALVFLVVGLIFAHTSLREELKAAIVVVPFAGTLLDFGTRFLARYHPAFIYIMIAAGATTALSFVVMVVLSLYEMWAPEPRRMAAGR